MSAATSPAVVPCTRAVQAERLPELSTARSQKCLVTLSASPVSTKLLAAVVYVAAVPTPGAGVDVAL